MTQRTTTPAPGCVLMVGETEPLRHDGGGVRTVIRLGDYDSEEEQISNAEVVEEVEPDEDAEPVHTIALSLRNGVALDATITGPAEHTAPLARYLEHVLTLWAQQEKTL